MRYIVLLALMLISGSVLRAQTDTEFWFGAPDVSSEHGNGDRNGTPIYLHVTAAYATHVIISRPADPGFVPIEFDLLPMEHQTVHLDGVLNIDEIETYPSADLINGMQNKGFKIEASPGEITAYYELDQYWNRDIFPLKGTNGLGQEFWVTTQNLFRSGDYSGTAWSGFVIVATENNTTVTINQNDDWLYFAGPATRTITLDAGETFAFRALERDAIRHINGVHVTSDKDIAITVYDDSMEKGGCRDIMGDQIVPVSLVGQEYIVMKGYLSSNERIFITGTQDNTDVYVEGALVATIDAGEVYNHEVTLLATHVWASAPVYVNHLTGFGCELGGALLPTIDGCTGSHDVTFTRTPNGIDQFYVNIMVRNDTNMASPTRNQAIHNFTLNVGGTSIAIPDSYFEYIQDSAFAVLKQEAVVDAFFAGNIPPGAEAQVQNPIARYHLGVINGGASTGCKYGYFSDYAASPASAGLGGALAVTQDIYCNLDPIRLVASGGTAYSWQCISDPAVTAQITDTSLAAPYFYPATTGDFVFSVKVFGECFTDTTINMLTRVYIGPNSDFVLSDNEGCSPFTTTLTNVTDTNYADKMIWVFDNPYEEVNQDTIPFSYDYTLPPNTSDTIQTYRIRLFSFAPYNSCRNIRTKYVKVKPEMTAGFSVDTTQGCHPLLVNFTNESTGNLDSTSFTWEFGDNSQSFIADPSHTYDNYGLDDSTFTAKLVTESPYGCLDSITQNITVHPRVRTALAIETSASCSPLNITLNPGNSVGVDTFHWHIDYVYADSNYVTQSKNPINLYHRDTSLVTGPDTLRVKLWGVNRMGCVDSFPRRRIIVFPEVNAEFDMDLDEICDGDTIRFINNSQGYQLFYNWDFNDGTIVQDTSGLLDPAHAFFNRSDVDSVYNVVLTATSGYFCEDTWDTLITVHPFIRANFGLDYENNCTPLVANFADLSVRAHFYEWDFGDGNTTTADDSLFSHTYWNDSPSSDTTYTIRLVTENNEGCTDTLTRSLNIFPHVVASFGMTDTIGCSPLRTTFSNSSTGGLLSYLWDFGNSTTSTNASPSFNKTYTNLSQNDTIYYISLTASNPYGCDSTIMDSISVFASIDAEFNLPIADSCSPFTLRPENLSSVGAKEFRWEFIGNGFTSSDFEPVVPAFSNLGIVRDTITARLVAFGVDDAAHRACADTHSIQVLVYPELDVDFNLSVDEGCQPLLSNITNITNIPSGNYFEWTLDSTFYSALKDPPSLTIQNLTDTDQTHTLTLTGESQYGCRDTAFHTLTVYSLVDARFTVNKSGICSADSFQIDRRTSRGGIVTYEWNLGGTPSNTTDSMFWYSFTNTTNPNPVQQRVRLTVYNSQSCRDTISRLINVFPEVRADFNVDQNTFCYPHNTLFTNNTENANNYFWDYGDGTGSNDQDPEPHTFANFDNTNDAVYDIKLIARSQYNCYDSISDQVTVYAQPAAEFHFPVTVDCPPFEAEMINESQGFDVSYMWDFGDGNSSTDENPTHLYVNNGSAIADIPIKLTVTSGGGKACIDTAIRTLRVYPAPDVDFEASAWEGCTPMNITFTSGTSNIANILWTIDGQPFNTLPNTSYRFTNQTSEDLTFEIGLRGTSAYNCVADTIKTITIFPTPATEFIPDPLVQAYNTELDQTLVTFYNQTGFRDAWSYDWDFGDGNTGDQSALEFDYYYGDHFWGSNENGNQIPITLLAWNTDNPECRDSVTYRIQIKPPPPEVSLEENIAGCEPFTVDFGSYTKYVYEDQMNWDFGIPGATSSDADPVFTYEEQGVYTVRLLVEGDGGSAWASRIITVHPKPEVDFSFNDSVVFVKSQNRPDEIINFYNHTRFGYDYEWYFENNLESGFPDETEINPTWYYEDVGTYYVALVSESAEGCVDTMISPIPIVVRGEASVQFPTGFYVDPSAPRDEYVSDPNDPDLRIFRPYAQGVSEYRLEVYNRWGVLVFESDDVNKGWNGFIDGSPAKQDVYIWRAKGRFTNGQPFEMSGDVTLIVAPVTGVNP